MHHKNNACCTEVHRASGYNVRKVGQFVGDYPSVSVTAARSRVVCDLWIC